MEELILFPCNGNALEALDCVGDRFKVIGFVDDNPEKANTTVNGISVYSRALIEKKPRAKVLAVPGSPASFQQRKSVIDGLGISEERYVSIIHKQASISRHTRVGINTLIMAGVVVGPNVTLGDHLIILPNTVIHHDCVISDFTLIGSNVTVAGSVFVNRNCYIGSGSSLINNIEIGENSLIGIGSNVIRSTTANTKYAGNPAREL